MDRDTPMLSKPTGDSNANAVRIAGLTKTRAASEASEPVFFRLLLNNHSTGSGAETGKPSGARGKRKHDRNQLGEPPVSADWSFASNWSTSPGRHNFRIRLLVTSRFCAFHASQAALARGGGANRQFRFRVAHETNVHFKEMSCTVARSRQTPRP
jgi:hypothetical protein